MKADLPTNTELTPFRKIGNIAICYATNDKYVLPLCVSIKSLIEHTTPEYNYDIVVLYNKLSDRNILRLTGLAQGAENVSIRVYDMQGIIGEYVDKLRVRAWWGVEVWFTIFLGEVFSCYRKVLKLDVDTIILDDVAKLYRQNMGEQWIGACHDMKLIRLMKLREDFREYCRETLGLEAQAMHDSYVNGGVLLCNITAWKKHQVGKKLLDKALENHEFRFLEQDVLNSVCYGHIRHLDQTWDTYPIDNAIQYNEPEDIKMWKAAFHQPRIIHYVVGDGLFKPWIQPATSLGNVWWEYARKLPFYEEIIYENLRVMMVREMKAYTRKLSQNILEII